MKLTFSQLRDLANQMERAQLEHEKATVTYETDVNEIRITYPLPVDFPKKPYQIKPKDL